MRALLLAEYGGPELLQVRQLPLPEPREGELRVRVIAAGLQPVDAAVRRGAFARGGAFASALPLTPGNEFAGVVDKVGADIGHFRRGESVLGWTLLKACAEYLVVPAAQVLHKPSILPWDEAGALSASGQTAHTALEALQLRAGETLLVHGAAGGVGTMAVQLARAYGLRVIGSASPRNHDYLRVLGAEPVAYGEGMEERLRAMAPGGIDAALDAAGGDALYVSLNLVRERRRIVTLVEFTKAELFGVQAVRSQRSTARLGELLQLHAQGQLRVHVSGRYALEDAAAAHREIEAGHVRGKLVLRIGAAHE
ncbi:NADP-dependent oxidoreductase [Solimonas sp. K1W22B-7]|nr:NADP-dependent oxidoreductase [Solimonas sp. K1W22B-7]